MTTSVRPPGTKFEYRRIQTVYQDWVENPEWWTLSEVNDPETLLYDPDLGLHLLQTGSTDNVYTYGYTIDYQFTDVRIVAKYNTGENNGNGMRSEDQIVGIRLKESDDKQKCLLINIYYNPTDNGTLWIMYPVDYSFYTSWDDFYTTDPYTNGIGGGIFEGDTEATWWVYDSEYPGLHTATFQDIWIVVEMVGNSIRMEHWNTDPELGGDPTAWASIDMVVPSQYYSTGRVNRNRNWIPLIGEGVSGRCGIGWNEPSYLSGFKSFRVWDLTIDKEIHPPPPGIVGLSVGGLEAEAPSVPSQQVSVVPFSAPSVRPPGDKFEWRRAAEVRQRRWVEHPELWTSIPGNSGANELVYDPTYGLRVPDLDVDDYTQGSNIDVNLTDVRVVAKWNPGNEDMGEINDASMEICLRESADSLRHLTAQCFFDVYDAGGGDDLNMVLYPVVPGVSPLLYQSVSNPEWNNYDGTGIFGSSADSGGNVWLYEWEDPPAKIEAGIRPNTDYWMVFQAIGNTLTIEHWLTDPELGTGSPLVGGTITLKAPITPRPGSPADIDRRPTLGTGIYGTVGIGYVQVAGRTTYGIKEFRVFDMSGSNPLVIQIAGISIYTSDQVGSGGPLDMTIDGTEDVYIDPVYGGAHPAQAHILESIPGGDAPNFVIHNQSTTNPLRWRIYDQNGNRTGMPNGFINPAPAAASFDLGPIQGPGKYFLFIWFDATPDVGAYRLSTGPPGQLVVPYTPVPQKVEIFPPAVAGFSIGGLR